MKSFLFNASGNNGVGTVASSPSNPNAGLLAAFSGLIGNTPGNAVARDGGASVVNQAPVGNPIALFNALFGVNGNQFNTGVQAALGGLGGSAFATVGPFDQTVVNRSPVLEQWAKMLVNNNYVSNFVAPIVKCSGDVVDVAFFKDDTSFTVRKLASSLSSTPHNRAFGYNLERTTLDEIFIERTFVPSRNNRGPLAMGQAVTQGLKNDIDLMLEYFVASKVFTSGNYGASRKTSPGTKWGSASATPFQDIFDNVSKVIGNGSSIGVLFGLTAWEKFSCHAEVIEKVNGTVGGSVSLEQVAAKLGVKECRVGRAKYLDNGTMTDIWGDHVLIFAMPQNLNNGMITGFDASAFYQYRCDLPEVLIQQWATMDYGIGGDYYQAAVIQKFVTTGSDYLKFLVYDVIA
jgi:hypothetical protein